MSKVFTHSDDARVNRQYLANIRAGARVSMQLSIKYLQMLDVPFFRQP
jgi:hypothetical protein